MMCKKSNILCHTVMPASIYFIVVDECSVSGCGVLWRIGLCGGCGGFSGVCCGVCCGGFSGAGWFLAENCGDWGCGECGFQIEVQRSGEWRKP